MLSMLVGVIMLFFDFDIFLWLGLMMKLEMVVFFYGVWLFLSVECSMVEKS